MHRNGGTEEHWGFSGGQGAGHAGDEAREAGRTSGLLRKCRHAGAMRSNSSDSNSLPPE